MKRIDDYLDNFYTGVNSEEVYELKNEIKDHLLELVQEFVEEGIEENKAIDMAIEQFDDGPDMQKEILMLLKKDNTKLKKSNNFLMKITNKMLNTFKIIFLISIIVYGSSRAYCGLAQHKTSEYNAKINYSDITDKFEYKVLEDRDYWVQDGDNWFDFRDINNEAKLDEKVGIFIKN